MTKQIVTEPIWQQKGAIHEYNIDESQNNIEKQKQVADEFIYIHTNIYT